MAVILELRDLSRYFGGLAALSNVSLQVEAGTLLGIIGPNGAGKTTLFNVISGSLRPTSGSVHLIGIKISGLRPDKICRLGIARTYQLVRPFPSLTPLENVLVSVCFGRSAEVPRRRRVAAAMAELELMGLADRASQPVDALTLMERKLLEIARALATEPRVLLLDEIVAGLTPVETDRMMETIRGISQRGITVVMIEHIVRVVTALCREVCVLQHGTVIAHGTPAEVVCDPVVIEAYLGDASVCDGTGDAGG